MKLSKIKASLFILVNIVSLNLFGQEVVQTENSPTIQEVDTVVINYLREYHNVEIESPQLQQYLNSLSDENYQDLLNDLDMVIEDIEARTGTNGQRR